MNRDNATRLLRMTHEVVSDMHEAADEIDRLIATCMANDALIKQQQAEIESNRKEIDGLIELLRKDRAEIERLQTVVDAAKPVAYSLKQSGFVLEEYGIELIEALASLKESEYE